jgi:hypothetical protein
MVHLRPERTVAAVADHTALKARVETVSLTRDESSIVRSPGVSSCVDVAAVSVRSGRRAPRSNGGIDRSEGLCRFHVGIALSGVRNRDGADEGYEERERHEDAGDEPHCRSGRRLFVWWWCMESEAERVVEWRLKSGWW